ncbi:MAG: tectonin domain-containing protein [Thermoplasmata archaeon]
MNKKYMVLIVILIIIIVFMVSILIWYFVSKNKQKEPTTPTSTPGSPPSPNRTTTKLLGVGTDGHLYIKNSVDEMWNFIDKNTCCVRSAYQLADGRILGVGATKDDNKLYIRDTLNDPWRLIDNSCCVQSITQAPDGKIYGVGTDNKVYYRSSVNDKWEGPVIPGDVVSISFTPDGKLVAIGTNTQIWEFDKTSNNWNQVSKDIPGASSIYVSKDGTIYGVGFDNKVYTKETFSGKWEGPLRNSCCVNALASVNV